MSCCNCNDCRTIGHQHAVPVNQCCYKLPSSQVVSHSQHYPHKSSNDPSPSHCYNAMPSHYSPCPHYNTPFPSYSASPHSNTLQPSCCSLPTYSHNHSSQGHSPIIYHNSSSPSTHLQSRTHYLPRTVSPLHVSHSMNGYHTPQLHSSSMRYKPALRSISVFEKLESSSEEDTEDAEDPFDILAEIPGKSKTRSHYNDVQPRKKSVRSKSSKKHPKRSSQSFEVVNVSDSNEEQSNDKIEDPFELLPDIPCKAETVSHGCHTPQLCPSTHQSYCSVQQKKRDYVTGKQSRTLFTIFIQK